MRARVILFFIGILLVAGCKDKTQPEHFRYFRNYSRNFNDLNNKHLKAARKWGIDPLSSPAELKKLKGRLEKIESCSLFEVDKLTHSEPYLVPKAHQLLRTISRNFRDSLASKGLSAYKLVVTSVLRTDESVKRLRRKNLNASSNSAHLFGTTFDIAYARFKKDSWRGEVRMEKLKSVLAEVLYNLRKDKRCYVRYEYKQGCFHITVR